MRLDDPPSAVLMQPLGADAVNTPAEPAQAPERSVTAPDAVAPAASAPDTHAGGSDSCAQPADRAAPAGEAESRAPPPGADGASAQDAAEGGENDNDALEKALDEGGPDFYEPAAWTQAADFILKVHKELPDELREEALRSQQVASHLFQQAQGLLTGMCCPPNGELIQPQDEEDRPKPDHER